MTGSGKLTRSKRPVVVVAVAAAAVAVVVVPTPAIKHKTNQGHVPVYARVLPNFGKNRSNSFLSAETGASSRPLLNCQQVGGG